MKNLKTVFNFMLGAIMLSACESPVGNIPKDKLSQTESKLVVSSVIAPQLPYINVIVSESAPLFSDTDATNERINDATVKISDGVNEIVIPYDKENNLYSLEQSKFPIKASTTYFLTVTDGKRTVTSKCKVPNKAAEIKSYEFDTLVSHNSVSQDSTVSLRLSWQDIPVDTNFYRVNAVMNMECSAPFKEVEGKFTEIRYTAEPHFNWNWQQGRNDLLSDKHLDGAVLKSPVGKVNLPQINEKTLSNGDRVKIYPKTKIHSVLIEVYNVDINYYKYERSIEASINSDSPFSEPTQIYTNVTGGLGCFSAYNASQVKVSFAK